MPRNDQVSRQWYLLRKLESSRGATFQELADSLPDDYPKNPRTIRRELEALESVGFPLVTEQSNSHTCWRLMEGFKSIPTLGFSTTQLMALIFSRNLLKPLGGTEIHASLNSALNKAAVALPPQDYPYQLPLGFDIESYVQDALMVVGKGREVELLFSKQAAAWVKDKIWHASQEISLLKDGRLKMTIQRRLSAGS